MLVLCQNNYLTNCIDTLYS